MHPASVSDALTLTAALVNSMASVPVQVQLAIAPSLLHLSQVRDATGDSNICIVAQDVAVAIDTGAHTGDVSATQLHAAGVGVVLVGHSERRSGHAETDQVVGQKLQAAIRSGLQVILCVGEQLSEREAGQAEAVVLAQIQSQLKHVAVADWQRWVMVAYEPVWAIGTGRTASPQDAQAMHAAIRQCLLAHDPCLGQTAVLYGGSVKPDNAASLAACPDIDGALVGGAALDAASFIQIAQAFA